MHPLEDQHAIQRTLNAYSQATSAGEWEAAIATYRPDGAWEVPHLPLRVAGHAALRETMAMLGGAMDYVVQLNSPAVIEIDGDTARARSAIRECGKTAGKDEGFEYFGLYEDDLVRTPEGWRFERRVFRAVGSHTFPLNPGAVVVPR